MPTFATIPTPAFLVDHSILRRNCERMRQKAVASRVIFRPHVKTHKVVEIGLMQHRGEKGPITASTLAEVEHFAAAGFGDITYAVPIAPEKLGRAAEIARRIERLNILIDNFDALGAIESLGFRFDVFLKIDCGYHRAGVDPDDPRSIELADRMAKSKAVRFQGVLTHAGHSYHCRSVDEVKAIAKDETSALTRFRDRSGLKMIRSVGSTPTLSVVDRFHDTDEVRPGNYVFFDAAQVALGSCRREDVAVSVLTTVVGSYPERGAMILDAGALALSKDLGSDHIEPDGGYGILCDTDLNPLPMKIAAVSQEHGKVLTESPLPLGTRLRIIPNHSCLTAAMYDVFQIVDNNQLIDQWRPVRGW